MRKEKKFKQKRSWWFRIIKKLMKGRYKEPEFIYLGEKPTKASIILSNHEGTDAPLSLEIYADYPIKMWGTYEMNSGLITVYKYLANVYYHQKKHWNLFVSRVFCLLAAPLTYMFYKGLRQVSTYTDARFKTTLSKSIEAIQAGENIVIFPENSEDGYHAELKQFYAGFVMLARLCYKKGIDVPIYVSYFKLNERQYVFDKPIFYSELIKKCANKEEIAEYLLERCNSLGKMSFDNK